MINQIKGLVIKDWALMSRQLKLMLVYIVFFVGISSYWSDTSFQSGFLSVILFMLTINCFAYDEQVNFEKLAAASPVSPFRIVLSRYISALTIGIAGSAAIMLGNLTVMLLRRTMGFDGIKYGLAGLGVSLFILSLAFPLVFKFGVNRSRIIILLVSGIPIPVFILLSKFLPRDFLFRLLINRTLIYLLPFIFVVVVLAALAISVAISVRIFKNKEF
ncbi:MAG: ABC-2 transporter permease [Clostridiales bacterium]|jgi:ABC-2 type transport system permease protein|nr:ABC-2 transporter permease [Clostridiales bacterium]